jgi:serine phosphatase RsbU (regulator of sigma subunit)/ligand-binding sensor domain-containing protein
VGQNLKLPVRNYTSKSYGRKYDAISNCILTDHRNIIYAGNANGILEYDASQWRFIPVRQGAYVTSMDIDPAGKIFVGSQNEFGFLATDPKGMMYYRSLSDSLSVEDHYFTNIWKTHATSSHVYFQAEEALFIFQSGMIRVLYPETSFHTSFLVNDRLYVRERSTGLLMLDGERLIPVKGGELFAELGIFSMLSLDESGRAFIATRERGLFIFTPGQGVEKIRTENEAFLIQSVINGGISLNDGKFAFNTLREGLIITNRQGEIQTVINQHAGLLSNDIKDIWQDEWQNIWCALENGISKIDYASPVSFYHENAGLEGSVHSIIRYQQRLYAGTTRGLFMEDLSKALNISLEFVSFEGIRDQVWDMEIIGTSLLIGTTNGLYMMDQNGVIKVADINAFVLHYLENENILLVGGVQGLAAFRKTRNWVLVKDFPEITENINSIAVNHSGFYKASEIWLGTSYQGVIKMLLNHDLTYEMVQYYGENDGLPQDWVIPMSHLDSIVFGTRAGLMRFNDEFLIRRMLPDSLQDKPEYFRGYFEGTNLYDTAVITPFSYLTNAYDKTWVVIDNEILMIPHKAPQHMLQKPFKGIDLGRLNKIYAADEHIVWFAAAEGLARFDMRLMENPHLSFHASIRSVLTNDDSLIFHGSYKPPDDPQSTGPNVLFKQPDVAVPILEHANNDLTFTFTSPYYDYEDRNLFSWRLEGGRSDWSNWMNRKIASFTNLREGEYDFLVRAKNIYGDISEASSYRFTIKPPWHRTTVAYIFYILISGMFVFLSIRLGQIRLRRQNERLEALVRQRTAEIRAQNIELAKQKKEITDSIFYAERIQRAVLPRTERISEKLKEYFILFKPKDIVSGDFYWLADNGMKIIIAAVDCTGHGVPGAFMSMLGVSFLNKIILEQKTSRADMILNDLRENVIQSLQQTGREGEAQDGMDMALVVLDLENMTVEFAGAHNPLYMIRGHELNETKADRMPISFQSGSGKFSNHNFNLLEGDCLYLFSDGFADQFGGPAGKKFKYKQFKKLLLEIRDKSMEEQKVLLDDTLESWKNHEHPEGGTYEQIDDILVIGIRI